MFGKISNFLWRIGCSGVISIFITFGVVLMLAFGLMLALVPVEIIFGSRASKAIAWCFSSHFTFYIIYVLVFTNQALDEFELPSLSTLLRKFWWKRVGDIGGGGE